MRLLRLPFFDRHVSSLIRPEERRARKIRRRLLLGGIVASLLLGLCWLAARPASHAIKAWHARRLAREAAAAIEKGDWKEATERLQDAYQLSSTEVEVWRPIARLLWHTGQVQVSLEWWDRIEHAGRLGVQDRREYAASALAGGELTRAQRQIDWLFAQTPTHQPVDNLLAGQLAARRGDSAMSFDYAERTLGDDRAKPNETLSAAVLALSLTAPDSRPYAEAWKRIEDLAGDTANVMSLDALTFLAQHRFPAAPVTDTEKSPSSLAPSGVLTPAPATLSAGEVASRLEHHPKARPFHQLVAIQLRARENPAHADRLLDDAVQQFRGGDDDTLVTLNAWLYNRGRYQTLLDVLPLERARHRGDLYLQHLDALGALGRFGAVADLLSSHRFNLDEMSEHMYLAVAKTRLGQMNASANEWQRALEAAGDGEKCMILGDFAERADAREVANSAYARAIVLAPKMRAAYVAQLRVLEQLGRTAEAHSIATKLVELSPTDNTAHLEEQYLRLLQGGVSRTELEQIERQAEIAVLQRPFDWNARKTLGLARLQSGKLPEALEVFRHVRVNGNEPPGVLAVRAAILFANGWKDEARGDAKNLAAEHLLPEERALLTWLFAN